MIKFTDFLKQDSDAVLIRTSYRTDLPRLQEFFRQQVKPLKKQYQGNKTWHGGWSIQSNTGEINDGWQPGGALITKNTEGELLLDKAKHAEMFSAGTDFRTPTPLYQGIAEEMIMGLDSTGFTAKRTRFSELEVGGVDSWHRDNTHKPTWRGHIVVDTNPDCYFWWISSDGKQMVKRHIPADGYLYMVRVDVQHRISNHGSTDRIHVLTDSATPLSNCILWVDPLAFLRD